MGVYFQNQDHGGGIKSLIVGVVCVSPGFDKFFKNEKRCIPKAERIDYEGIPFTVKILLNTRSNLNMIF